MPNNNQRLPLRKVRVRISNLDSLKSFVEKPAKPRRKRIIKHKVRRIYRLYTSKQKLQIVYLRHKSLTNQSTIWHRWNEIFHMTGVKVTTAIEIVRRHFEPIGLEEAPLRHRPLPQDVQ